MSNKKRQQKKRQTEGCFTDGAGNPITNAEFKRRMEADPFPDRRQGYVYRVPEPPEKDWNEPGNLEQLKSLNELGHEELMVRFPFVLTPWDETEEMRVEMWNKGFDPKVFKLFPEMDEMEWKPIRVLGEDKKITKIANFQAYLSGDKELLKLVKRINKARDEDFILDVMKDTSTRLRNEYERAYMAYLGQCNYWDRDVTSAEEIAIDLGDAMSWKDNPQDYELPVYA